MIIHIIKRECTTTYTSTYNEFENKGCLKICLKSLFENKTGRLVTVTNRLKTYNPILDSLSVHFVPSASA